MYAIEFKFNEVVRIHLICFIRQRNNFFRVPDTIEMAKNWVIEEIEKEMLEESAALESSTSSSLESPVMPSPDTGSSLEQIRKKLRLERQQQVKYI